MEWEVKPLSQKIKITENQRKRSGVCDARFGTAQAKRVRSYHQGFPGYAPTALKKLEHLAEYLGIAAFYVKDESTRFGLNAFKGLGGSYGIGRYIAELCEIPEEELTYERLLDDAVRKKTKGLTFVTATDGNHGRGIAWAARELGLNAVVYLPKNSAKERLSNIQRLGAGAEILELNYDDTVRFAAACEKEKGWVLVQDTAWEGYEKIPAWIMQGYMTMALEAAEQMGDDRPTHIFLQAGVGAMSGALAAFFADYYKDAMPKIIIVEPDKADCIYQTAKADDGTLHKVSGDMDTIMAGLACGEPCTIGWDMLCGNADAFASIPDQVAAKGMRILGNPLPGDARVISGESGASTSGFVAELLLNKGLQKMRDMIGIDAGAKVLLFSTEGDTDQENYRNIVWNGAYPGTEQ